MSSTLGDMGLYTLVTRVGFFGAFSDLRMLGLASGRPLVQNKWREPSETSSSMAMSVCCVHINMYIYIHICMYTCTYVYIHTYENIDMYICIYTYTNTSTCYIYMMHLQTNTSMCMDVLKLYMSKTKIHTYDVHIPPIPIPMHRALDSYKLSQLLCERRQRSGWSLQPGRMPSRGRSRSSCVKGSCRCGGEGFEKLGGPFWGVVVRIIVFGVYIQAPDVWKPNKERGVC